MSIPEHYSSHPEWKDVPWDYQATGHKENGVRPCISCSQPIDHGWITDCGNGPFCSPACMGWDDKEVMDRDISAMPRIEITEDGKEVDIDGSFFWTDWVDDPSDDPAWRAEVKEEYAWAWERIQGTKNDPNEEVESEPSEWWQQVREYWGNPKTLEDYERVLREMQHREQIVGVGRKDLLERHAIELMILEMRGDDE